MASFERKTAILVAIALVAAGVIGFLVLRRSGTAPRSTPAAAGGSAAADPWDTAPAAAGSGLVLPRRPSDLAGTLGLKSRPSGPPVTVTGAVRNAVGGGLVAGAEVAFLNDSGEVTATADGTGRYSITVASGVAWKIHARAEQGIGHPEVFVPAAPSATPQERDLEIHALAVIRGRVVDARGATVAGVEVNVEAEASFRPLLEAAIALSDRTDGAGRFELQTLPGAARVRGAKGMAQGVAEVPALAPGGTAEVEIKLADAVVVRGRVLDGTEPVAGATIKALTTLSAGYVNEKREFKSRPDGSFEIVMPAGYVRLEAKASGRRAPTWIEELTSGARRDGIELVLTDDVTVTGKVVTTSGEPVIDARVRLIAASSYDGKTDRKGTFSIRVPEKIAYHVKVIHSEGHHEQVVETWDEPPTLVMRRHGALRLEVTGTKADVTVTIASWVPAPPATPHDAVATSFRGNGVVEIATLEPGTYQLSITAPGKAPVKPPTVTIAEGKTETVKVTF